MHYPHLLCPVCSEHLTPTAKNAFCPRGHSFDRARQGYLNLQLAPTKTQYTKTLYQARQHLFRNGVFDPLLSSLGSLIPRRDGNGKSPTILDAGCGDGSLLAALTREHNLAPIGLGIDICKDAVKIASQAYPHLTWCVADLANPPVADSTQDIIINILAPANYAAFRRLLTPGGTLVKVMPGSDHFKEIRLSLQTPAKDSASSQEYIDFPESSETFYQPHFRPAEPPPTIAHAQPHFTFLDAYRLTYDVSAAHNIEHFIQMTPLAWHTLPEKKEAAVNGNLQKIRLDYYIVILTSQ
ncbi:MAG: methyltransferase domain-containing protein [Gracilibacteraceae bacterium]|nr:methyltransferase domain-containing protein [Gracilibacteraceae bacterium]